MADMHSKWRWQRAATILSLLMAAWGQAAAQEKKEEKKESPPDAVALYADAASFQNNGAFELASDEWAKFLAKYPNDPLTPKAQHYAGVCNVQLKKFDKAAAAFAAVLKTHPNFEFAEDAYLNLAWSQYSQAGPQKLEMYTKAAESFAELQKKYPKGKYGDQALFFLGESLYNSGKKKEAIPFYQQMVKDFEKSPLRCDALYALGVSQEEVNQYAEAGVTYDLFLKDCATSPLVTEVKMRKAETLLQGGKLSDAAKQFAEVAAVPGFAQADHAIYREAYCLTKQDKFADAGALYGKLATAFPTSSHLNDAILSAGRCFYRADKMDDAANWFKKIAETNKPESPEAAHWLSRILIKGKKPAEAVAVADKVLPTAKDNPYLVNLQMDRADALYEIPEKRTEAIAAYLKLAEEHPQHELAPQAYYNAAFSGLETKKFDDGLKYAAGFLKAFPKDRLVPDVRYIQAECELQLGKYAEAEKLYRELLKDNSNHAEIDAWRVRFGLSLFLQKKYAETVMTLSPLLPGIKSKDALAEGQYLIGASQFNQEKIPEAVAALNASLVANPRWRQADETILYLSRCQRKQNQLKEAKASIEKIMAEFPNSRVMDQVRYRLGEYAYAADDYKGAIADYDLVLAKYPDSAFVPYAQYGKGWSLLKSKDYPAASESFTSLINKMPKHQLVDEAQFARAMCRRQSGDLKGAVEDLDAYLKTNPDLEHKSDALYERGLTEVAMKNNAAAIATFSALVKDNPKYAAMDKAVYELAWALKSDGKAPEALALFSRLATEFPDSPLTAEALFHVAEDHYDKKKYDEAAKAYVAAKQKAKDAELVEKIAYKMGWALFQQKQYQPALTSFTEQLGASPKGPLAGDAMFMKAESLFRLEKYKEALPAFLEAGQSGMVSQKMEPLMLLHAGQSAGQVKQWDESLRLLDQIQKKYPETNYLPEALYEQGWAKQNSGKLDDALKDYEEAATRSRDQVGARARFMIGEIQFEKKNFEDAIKQFQRVVFGFGGEKATAEVKVWQAQAAFEMARCWEVQIEGADAKKKQEAISSAKRNYTYVVEKHPSSTFVPKAKERLDALSKL